MFKKSKKTSRTPPGEEGKRGEGIDDGSNEGMDGGLEWKMGKDGEEPEGHYERIRRDEEKGRQMEGGKRWDGEKDRRTGKKMGEEIKNKRRGEEWKDLEKRINKLERKEKGKEEEEGSREMEERIRKVEKMWDRKERQERRRNIFVKGYKKDEKEMESRIGEIFKKIGAEVEVDEIRVIKTGREDWEGIAVVSLKSEENKKEVMRKKKGLRGKKIWIEEDLT